MSGSIPARRLQRREYSQAARQPETARANCTFESKARDNASGGPEDFLKRKFPTGAVNAEAAAKMSKNRLPLKRREDENERLRDLV